MKKMKSVWKDKMSGMWSFFCPLCKTERALPYGPKPGNLRHYSQIGISTAFVTLLFWDFFHWRGLVSFVPLWALFEAFYRTRSRVALSCPHCGFDPFLTLVDSKKAKAEIEAHWRRKFAERGVPYPEKTVPGQKPAIAPGQSSEAKTTQ